MNLFERWRAGLCEKRGHHRWKIYSTYIIGYGAFHVHECQLCHEIEVKKHAT